MAERIKADPRPPGSEEPQDELEGSFTDEKSINNAGSELNKLKLPILPLEDPKMPDWAKDNQPPEDTSY